MMAERMNSSQESLPLSQETFNCLWNMMDFSGRSEMLASVGTGQLDSSECNLVPQVQPHGAHVPSTRSSLPATNNWPGDYGFQLLFGHQEKVNKHTNWTYSEVDNKLYVKKDVLCPFSFRTNTVMSHDVVLRAMAVYTSPEHASEAVTRCVNHSQQELLQRVFEAEHLIRSESVLAHYEIDAEKRHSVVVPFENPPVGQDFSTYIFKFACWGSCAGGPNRRAITLMFTLEQRNCVLGRITLDLKICACPGRDKIMKEKPQSITSGSASKKIKADSNSISIPQNFFESLPKKKKIAEKKEEFIIRVKDVECYNFLNSMKRLFQSHKRFGRLSPECRAALFQIYKSSSDEEQKEN